jgi:hypothetical protein
LSIRTEYSSISGGHWEAIPSLRLGAMGVCTICGPACLLRTSVLRL